MRDGKERGYEEDVRRCDREDKSCTSAEVLQGFLEGVDGIQVGVSKILLPRGQNHSRPNQENNHGEVKGGHRTCRQTSEVHVYATCGGARNTHSEPRTWHKNEEVRRIKR